MKDQNSPEDPLLMDHEVDGIRELDNKLPRWWVWLFYLTIFFSIAYLYHYHVLDAGDLMAEAYEKEMAAGEKIKAAAMKRMEMSLETLEPSTDPELLREGEEIFLHNCAPCHRPDGGGLVGPNLTDDYWIHGDSFLATMKVIMDGVPAKGMVSWKNLLNAHQLHAVGSYVYTLRGTDPPNPKPPENQTTSSAPTVNPYE